MKQNSQHSWKKIYIEGYDVISQCKSCNMLRIKRTLRTERGSQTLIFTTEYVHFGEKISKAGECKTTVIPNNKII